MSNDKTNAFIFKATNVAENTNDDSEIENTIQSEFIIISSDEQLEADKNKADVHQKKKTSTKDQKKRKNGPSIAMLNLIKEKQESQKLADLKAEEEAKENQRREEERQREEEEKLRLEKEYREKIKEKEKRRIQRQKDEGIYLTKGQRKKLQRTQVQFEAAGIQIPTRYSSQSNNNESSKKRILYEDHRKTNFILSNTSTEIDKKSESIIENEEDSTDIWEIIPERVDHEQSQTVSSEEETDSDYQVDKNEIFESINNENDEDQTLSPMARIHHRLERYHNIYESHRSSDVLRAPVICVLGHVDAGKTTLLDNLRQTHVQINEAGGITQQIGATNVPLETLYERTKMCREIISRQGEFIVPGLMIIDTPGHETFKNLRLRGSSLCDLAILVVDIMHGLEPQTIESIELLRKRKTPFIIALNKIDLLYGWKSDYEKNIELVLKEQTTFTQNHFEQRCNHIIVQFAEQGLNVALYNKNPDPNEYISMIPTSARSSDGMGSLIALIIEKCQTILSKQISYTDELQATIMEVKPNDSIGTTIDVVLVNGCLSVGDKIIIAGQETPIVTRIRKILIPESNQELRTTNQYKINTTVKGTCGIKIVAKDLEKSMAGFPLFVIRQDDEIDYYKNEINIMLETVLNSIELKDKGVYVHASTLGSLEAFLQLLKASHIPYAGVNIGPVHRRDVIRASTQLEKDIEWATILAFDVKIEKDAQEYAKLIGIKIFQNDQIYHLRDMFITYREQMKKVNQEKYRHLAVFPCKLKILPDNIFHSRDPIICGVRIEDGFIKLGTPICVPSRNSIDLGRIIAIEKNHKSLDIAEKGSEVCIKIEPISGETPKMYGRHFDSNDILMSKISRSTIDIVKAYFRDEMKASDWKLMIELKKIFQIV